MASEEHAIASPGSSKLFQLKDSDVGYEYIEFPEDTFFLESMAKNTSFAPHVAYVPVQRFINGVEESHLYEVRAGMGHAKHLAGPISSPDGSTDVTIFGSALSSAGMLYMCAFNRNSILGLDLNDLVKGNQNSAGPVECQLEVPETFSPNDVAIDPNDETVLYVAGGSVTNLCYCICCYQFANSAFGAVYKIKLDGDMGSSQVSIHSDGFNTLAGIEVMGNELWVAQLFDIVRRPEAEGGSGGGCCGGGDNNNDICWKGHDGKGQVWMADNIDRFQKNWLLCPAYSTVSEDLVDNIMSRSHVSSLALTYMQLATACIRGESIKEALLDPEVSLNFSNTYIEDGVDPQPVRLIFLDPTQGHNAAVHFEVDLADTRSKNKPREVKGRDGEVKGMRHFFNEQVTHAGTLTSEKNGQGYVVCVNFEQPRLLLFKDDVFRQHTSSVEGAGAGGSQTANEQTSLLTGHQEGYSA